jgi:hypothetical protein
MHHGTAVNFLTSGARNRHVAIRMRSLFHPLFRAEFLFQSIGPIAVREAGRCQDVAPIAASRLRCF